MKIAYFSPLNPVRSGISDYSEELLPYLAQYCEIDVFTDARVRLANEKMTSQFRCYGYADFDVRNQEQRYDVAVFQIGNGACHIEPYDYLRAYGGLTVLHELNISGIYGAKTLAHGDAIGFLRHMLMTEGASACLSVAFRFFRTRQFPGPDEYFMNRCAIKSSTGIIVHNEYVARTVSNIIRSNHRKAAVRVVHHHALPPQTWLPSMDASAAKAELGLEGYPFVVSSFGFMSTAKRIPIALRAFSRLLQVVPGAVYVLVGEISPDVRAEIEALGLGDRARTVGYVDIESFYRYILASDFCVNLRYPTAGETSGPLLRIMSVGRAAAVTNYAQFEEYPDDCCIKIDLGECEEDQLFEQMCRLAADDALREAYGRAARFYIQQHHSPEETARGYYQALEEVAGKDRLSA